MPFLRTKNYQTFEVIDDTTYEVVHRFEGAVNAVRALPGDEVELVENTLVLKSRAPHPCLAGYLELNSKTTFGHTKSGLPLYLFVPLNPAYPSFIVGSKEKDRSQKRVALVDFLEWTEHLPRGSLKQLLGAAGTLEAEEEALLWNACPYKNLKDGLAILEDDCPSRTPVEGITFNIDPEGCKDIDDCITIAQDATGVSLTITIADVASCVEEMGAVDLMAANQGQTLYRDGMAVRPMLPPFFSEEHCSLIANQPRRGVSLTLQFNKELVLLEPVHSVCI
jgi:exoribonuclease R